MSFTVNWKLLVVVVPTLSVARATDTSSVPVCRRNSSAKRVVSVRTTSALARSSSSVALALLSKILASMALFFVSVARVTKEAFSVSS
ncbi:TPA: hypothetical protein TZE12_002254 [Streptococcus suis]|uniref:hypothetical protein n=1 Tax=Streptococcus suis TaxID=1307 RepID=UPI002A771F07|nr:hypothetical protein [Streptococcus suis]HEL2181475.1 hypothetical protein [Streptococcus suis]